MKEQKKKRIVVFLLLISCSISGYMLLAASDSHVFQLNNLTQADSLIQRELSNFNIEQVEVATIKVDSNFSRKVYRVEVPPAFSKTQLHAELNHAFYKYSIRTPAKITFPEKDVIIHLSYHNSIIRTLKLQTNQDLVLNRKQAALLITFDSMPEEELINELISFGEPIPIVLKIENPLQASMLNKQLSRHYQRILFWLQNDEGKVDPSTTFDQLKQLEDILPSAMILQTSQNITPQADLTFIDVSDAHFIDEEMGRKSFLKVLDQLKTEPFPLAVIEGSNTTLDWLRQKLPELKKAGLRLVPPSPVNL